MREAVSCIFTFEGKIFMTQRQNYLKAFPGYHAFPGGKVDKVDSVPDEFFGENPLLKKFPCRFMKALCREMKEELGIDIVQLIRKNIIVDLHEIGIGITPEFNPYRFDTHFFVIDLKKKVEFIVGEDEAQDSFWLHPKALLDDFFKAKILAVPPIVALLKALSQDIQRRDFIDLSLKYDSVKEIPMIECVFGVKQFIPLSNTILPADRTNSFLIGDKDWGAFLIDPSPKDVKEKEKFIYTLRNHHLDALFLTHHHKDHHEFAPDLARHFKCPLYFSKDTFERIKSIWGKNYFDGLEIKLVGEGDVLTRSLGKDIILYAVPGHDEGQLALANEDMDWFIVGDLIQGVGTVVVGGPEGDMTKYLDSLKRVIEKSPKVIYPSHGIAMGGTWKIEETLKHRLMREEQIRGYAKEGRGVEEILQLIYGSIDPGLFVYARKNILSHLKKIEEDNKKGL
jgi:glyoxylase-like metal-dependent hydrolase (beta-lactamase superfamily II)/8-oxo-dGTP pyrophosphatase MutT (NUDIX family)